MTIRNLEFAAQIHRGLRRFKTAGVRWSGGHRQCRPEWVRRRNMAHQSQIMGGGGPGLLPSHLGPAGSSGPERDRDAARNGSNHHPRTRRRGGKAAVVIRAGLNAENGLRQAMLDAAKPNLFRIIGPNTLGLMVPALKLNASFALQPAQPTGSRCCRNPPPSSHRW